MYIKVHTKCFHTYQFISYIMLLYLIKAEKLSNVVTKILPSLVICYLENLIYPVIHVLVWVINLSECPLVRVLHLWEKSPDTVHMKVFIHFLLVPMVHKYMYDTPVVSILISAYRMVSC